jgi:integrase
VLLRRSNPSGEEIVDHTKTKLDQDIPLPPALMRVLRAHVEALPAGPMRSSAYLFPSTTGGMRSRSVLDKPFRDVLKALGWTLKVTPRGMRRTFNDLARQAHVHDIILRAISGHQTERMQRHYSTAQQDEMRAAVGKVISIAIAQDVRRRRARRRA